MPIINKQFAVTLPGTGLLDGGDPSERAVIEYVDIARELSVHYGKNIRQGQNFRVAGVQTAMRGANNEYDVGLSSLTRFSYCPSTSHAKKAWKESFFTWMKQKKLRGGVGSNTNYDDLEFAYEADAIGHYGSGTTSSLYQGGLADSDPDTMVMFGSASESSNIFSMQDYYESQHPIQPPSRYAFSNAVIKEAKYDDKFPIQKSFFCTSDASSIPTWEVETVEIPLVEDPVMSFLHLGGSNMDADMVTLPESAPVHCGLLKIESWLIPDDTVSQLQDDAILYVSIWVKSWTPFFAKRKTQRKRKGTRRWWTGRRGGRKSGRRKKR